MLRITADQHTGTAVGSPVEDITRAGAQQLLTAALEAEADTYIASHAYERDSRGHRLVVRNGYALPRSILTDAGPVTIAAPRVHDRRNSRTARFQSAILAPWTQLAPHTAQTLPALYLHGMATGDFTYSAKLFTDHHPQLSPTVRTALMRNWQLQASHHDRRALSNQRYVYLWADIATYQVDANQSQHTALMLIGIQPDNTRTLLATTHGNPQDTQDWTTLLRRLRLHGLPSPATITGHHTLGIWPALAHTYPTTRPNPHALTTNP